MFSKITVALAFIGTVCGVGLSAGILSGDDQGRVNLLLFLLLFAAIPLLSLLLSGILLTTGHPGVAAWIVKLPMWPDQFSPKNSQLNLPGSTRSWLFFQSQIVSLAFSFGAMLVFLALLLGTDVNFVWRSTLLESADLLPTLQLISLPWAFWQEAQPSIALLDISQNSRINELGNSYSGGWWRFALAAQVSYSLIPRAGLLSVAYWKYKQEVLANSVENLVNTLAKTSNFSAAQPPALAPLAYTTPSSYLLLDWAGAPDHCLTFITKSFGAPLKKTALNALSSSSIIAKPNLESALVVIVKSWEPPLGELKDILTTFPATEAQFILPMDWNDEQVKAVSATHLQEWRRFAKTIDGWQVLQPGEHS